VLQCMKPTEGRRPALLFGTTLTTVEVTLRHGMQLLAPQFPQLLLPCLQTLRENFTQLALKNDRRRCNKLRRGDGPQ